MVLCRTPDVMSKDNWLHKDNGYPTNQRTMSRGGHLLQILRLQLPRAPDIGFPSIGLDSSSCVNFVCVHHRLAILLRFHSTQYISRPKWLHSEHVHEFLLVILDRCMHVWKSAMVSDIPEIISWRGAPSIAEFEIFHYLLMRLSIYKARVTVSLHSCPSHVLLVQSDLYPSSYTRAVGSRLSLGSSPFRG